MSRWNKTAAPAPEEDEPIGPPEVAPAPEQDLAAEVKELRATLARTLEMVGTVAQGQQHGSKPFTPASVTADVNARVQEIINAPRTPIPAELEPGYAVICDPRGRNAKHVDAYMVMRHGNRVIPNGQKADVMTGAYLHDVRAGLIAVQRFRPYPDDAITEGRNEYFDFRTLGYIKGPDGSWYHPVHGMKALNVARKARGQEPFDMGDE
jgi:hypothetical protein